MSLEGTMYFWKIESLKEDIIQGNLTEKNKFYYALIYIAISVISFELIAYTPVENPNTWDTINSVGNILIAILGTVVVFKCNGGSSGNDFLGKYFSIGFVVSIRSIPILLLMLIALIFYYEITFTQNPELASTPADIFPFLLWYILVFWRICRHVSAIKNS
ncbi:hypothetical protein AB4140_07775 [Shewanella sp. 10N.286.51.B2]|uniref:hypothetical protein n=1 Tax=Shewanella sp. 10N.286.51.B2 TaxID=3229707 RepID=UPI00354D608E